MPQYEILILSKDARRQAYIEAQHGGAQGAVRSAMRIANGRTFEVWRDLTCLYRVPRQQITSRAA
jgi:hypothetical protein